MQGREETGHVARMKRQHPLFRNIATLLSVAVVSALLLGIGLSMTRLTHDSPTTATPTVSEIVASNGADRWVGDTQTTVLSFDFPSKDTQAVRVSPLFAHYYSSHHGAGNLGAPITPAFPTDQGWLQFFRSGALFLTTAQQGQGEDLVEVNCTRQLPPPMLRTPVPTR